MGLGKDVGAVIKGAMISKYLVRVDLSNEQNKKGGKNTLLKQGYRYISYIKR